MVRGWVEGQAPGSSRADHRTMTHRDPSHVLGTPLTATPRRLGTRQGAVGPRSLGRVGGVADVAEQWAELVGRPRGTPTAW
jgi:hypothetical protein